MRALFQATMFVAAPVAAAAQPAGQTVDVQLTSFDFTPSELHLRAGQSVVLRLTNASGGGHNFSAPQFFAAAQVAAGQNVIRNGTIEVPSHQTVSVRLTPQRGDYRLRCTHTLHTTFGMRGRIIVE
jgi:plastocyanin